MFLIRKWGKINTMGNQNHQSCSEKVVVGGGGYVAPHLLYERPCAYTGIYFFIYFVFVHLEGLRVENL